MPVAQQQPTAFTASRGKLPPVLSTSTSDNAFRQTQSPLPCWGSGSSQHVGKRPAALLLASLTAGLPSQGTSKAMHLDVIGLHVKSLPAGQCCLTRCTQRQMGVANIHVSSSCNYALQLPSATLRRLLRAQSRDTSSVTLSQQAAAAGSCSLRTCLPGAWRSAPAALRCAASWRTA